MAFQDKTNQIVYPIFNDQIYTCTYQEDVKKFKKFIINYKHLF